MPLICEPPSVRRPDRLSDILLKGESRQGSSRNVINGKMSDVAIDMKRDALGVGGESRVAERSGDVAHRLDSSLAIDPRQPVIDTHCATRDINERSIPGNREVRRAVDGMRGN